MTPRGKVYVIDDDEAMRDSLDFLLGAADFDVTLFESAQHFSPRTIEVYRANVMTKMQAGNLSEPPANAVLSPDASTLPKQSGR
jgi:FixJ family two-component response regulator